LSLLYSRGRYYASSETDEQEQEAETSDKSIVHIQVLI